MNTLALLLMIALAGFGLAALLSPRRRRPRRSNLHMAADYHDQWKAQR